MGNDYGDFGAIPFLDKLKMLADYAPLLSKLQAIIATDDSHEQALRVISAAKWAAGKTDTPIDNEALHHIEAVLRTKEGKDLFHWFVEKIEESGGGCKLIEQYWSYILFVAGALFLVGPQIVSLIKFLLPASALKMPKMPIVSSSKSITYQGSMIALAEVRKRLLETHADGIPQDADSAIEVITHALVAGSDKP